MSRPRLFCVATSPFAGGLPAQISNPERQFAPGSAAACNPDPANRHDYFCTCIHGALPQVIRLPAPANRRKAA